MVKNTPYSLGWASFSSILDVRGVLVANFALLATMRISPDWSTITAALDQYYSETSNITDLLDETYLIVNWSQNAAAWLLSLWVFAYMCSDTSGNCAHIKTMVNWFYWTQTNQSYVTTLANGEGTVPFGVGNDM